MGRVFLDVGAHDGQTLQEVRRPGYGFERIYAFEPMPAQYERLVAAHGDDPRVLLCPFGLSDVTEDGVLYGDNTAMEASIHPTKRDVDASVVTPCAFVEASAFFSKLLSADDEVIVKLNCEGAEVVILRNLIRTGEIHKCANVMIDFDIRKVTGYEHQEAEVLAELAAVGFDRYVLCETVMHGHTHQDRIGAWLKAIGLEP